MQSPFSRKRQNRGQGINFRSTGEIEKSRQIFKGRPTKKKISENCPCLKCKVLLFKVFCTKQQHQAAKKLEREIFKGPTKKYP